MPHSLQKTIDLQEIPELFRPLLREKVTVREWAAGEPIIAIGKDDDRILCLISGTAEVVVGYRATQEVILEQLRAGDVFGDLSFLTGRAWPSDAELVALEPCKFLEISVDSFQRTLRENSEFTLALLKSLGKKMVKVDRSDFASPSKAGGTDATAVCAYPAHPGLPDDVQTRFRSLALSTESILIVGENGVGKEIMAYAIFEAADTHSEVLVPVDVRRMGAESFFSEPGKDKDQQARTPSMEQMKFLFGEEVGDKQKGTKTSPGYLELAHDGTLFVRGANRLTPITQQKLLDALRTGHYCPVGSKRLVTVNFRLICTTEADPAEYNPDRHPLLYELKDNSLVIPPLRDRRAFIPALAQHYLEHYAKEMGRQVPEFEDLTLLAMIDYSWPGNDLELANAMRRAVLVSPGGLVRRQDLTLESRRGDSKCRYNLLRLRPIRQAFLSPLYPAILQSAFVPIFLAIVIMLFLGPPDPSKNLAAVIMWSLAWPGLIIGAFFGARISCSICAIGALSKLAKRIVSLEIPFPEILKKRSDFLIAGGILFIIWIECATDIRSSPFNLGLLLLSMFILAFVMNTVWSRQAWCRYLCPLGGMTGLLARTSLLELRADQDVCLSSCSTQDCYLGGHNAEGCPFSQVVATLHSNHFCKICGACAKNCPHDAIKLNLRTPGCELGEVRYVRTGTGFLVLGLIGGLLSDTVTRVPFFEHIALWQSWPYAAKYTLIFFTLIIVVNVVFMSAVFFSHRVFRERFSENYSRFALALLPLTCMGFLAFHIYYLLTLGPEILALVSQYFGVHSLSGTAMEGISKDFIFLIQLILIIIGLLWTLLTMYRLAGSTPRRRYPRRLGIVPHAIVSILFAALFAVFIRVAFLFQ